MDDNCPYAFIGFGAVDGSVPYEFTGLGDVNGDVLCGSLPKLLFRLLGTGKSCEITRFHL